MRTHHLPKPDPDLPGSPLTSPSGTRPEQRKFPERMANQPGPDVAYPVSAFVDDHRQLLARTHTDGPKLSATIEMVDGRMHVVRPGLALSTDRDTLRGLFASKYGSGPEAAYRSRFILVLEFLKTWRSEILEAGLADRARPMAVREEFVDYLLHYRLDAMQSAIPECALRRFLDEWGHRRM